MQNEKCPLLCTGDGMVAQGSWEPKTRQGWNWSAPRNCRTPVQQVPTPPPHADRPVIHTFFLQTFYVRVPPHTSKYTRIDEQKWNIALTVQVLHRNRDTTIHIKMYQADSTHKNEKCIDGESSPSQQKKVWQGSLWNGCGTTLSTACTAGYFPGATDQKGMKKYVKSSSAPCKQLPPPLGK